jgi:hypothetical protein
MALSITQTPASCSLAQSPIIFTVAENTPVYTSSSFQYVGELYYWQGGLYQSSSVADYTILKFPNTATVGIFDLNRIINSTLTDLRIDNGSNVMYYAVDFYWQYLSGSSYATGSHVRSQTYRALDGYGIFPEPIGQQISAKTPCWPLMTDGPVTQSVLLTDLGTMGVFVGNVGTTVPDRVIYNSNLGTVTQSISQNATTTSLCIANFSQAPSQAGFPYASSLSSLEWYSLQAFSGSTSIGTSVRFEVDCATKYPNQRIYFKNRYGQFNYIDLNEVSRQSFQTEKRTYSPQIGTWESSTFSYQSTDSSVLNYVSDSKQSLSANTNWLTEDWNDIIKQLLVSDELYWYDSKNSVLRPVTIATQNMTFKTGVVDKLIQYQFEFNFGQSYKLIL